MQWKLTSRKVLKQFVIEYWSLIILVGSCLAVISLSFQSGKWLMGWDHLMPEFDIGYNLFESLNAVWQQGQGVGHLGGMGHGADLVRQVITAVLLIFLEPQIIRPVLVLAMLLIGPVGVWFGGRDHFFKITRWVQFSSLIAGLVYLLNIGTVQIFYTPFEPFYWFYGLVPWVFWSLLQYLEKPSRKRLGFWFLASLVFTPSGWVQTTFVVYVIVLSLFLLGYWLMSSGKVLMLGRMSVAWLLMLFTNLFWLLPVVFFTLTSAQVTVEAKINRLTTPEVFYQNRAYGDISQVMQLKGYWFSLQETDTTGEVNLLLGDWVDHFDQVVVQNIGYFLFVLSLLGVLYLFIQKRKLALGVFLSYLVCLIALVGNNPPTGVIMSWLQDNIPLFEQIFRSPFVKWILPTVFIYSLLVSAGVSFLFYVWSKFVKQFMARLVGYTIPTLGIVVLLIVWTLPIWRGKLIYERMWVDAPSEYFELFEFMKTQPENAKVALLPAHTLWGWHISDWGYRGSGFLIWGLRQSSIERAYDVWSPYNEDFYSELQQAFHLQSSDYIDKVFEKYQVDYLLIDDSLVDLENPDFELYFSMIEEYLSSKQESYRLVWRQGRLRVYQRNWSENSVIAEVTSKSGNSEGVDYIFLNNGWYFEDQNQKSPLYPFASITDDLDQIVSKDSGFFADGLNLEVPIDSQFSVLNLPAFPEGSVISTSATARFDQEQIVIELDQPFVLTADGEIVYGYQMPLFILNDVPEEPIILAFSDAIFEIRPGETLNLDQVTFRVGQPVKVKLFSNETTDLDLPQDWVSQRLDQCWTREGVVADISKGGNVEEITLSATNASACMTYFLDEVGENSALFEITLEYKSRENSRPNYCISSNVTNNCLNQDIYFAYEPSVGWSQINEKVLVDPNQRVWFSLISRGGFQVGKANTVSYKKPTITKKEALGEYTFSQGVWNEFTTSKQVAFTGNSLAIQVKRGLSSIDSSIASLTTDQCDFLERGSISVSTELGKIIYQAFDEAAVCEYLVFRDVSSKDDYLGYIQGNQIQGRPPIMYVHNLNTNALLQQEVWGFEDAGFVYIPRSSYDGGLRIMFEGRSYLNYPSEFTLEKVQLFPISIPWLSLISVSEFENNQASNLTIVTPEWNRHSPAVYTTSIELQELSNILIFDQGYDEFWQAYSFEDTNWLDRLLPFIRGKKIDQVKVNGWTNGFVVDQSKTNDQSFELVAFYLPQYLQWAGFGAIMLTFAGLSAAFLINKNSRSRK